MDVPLREHLESRIAELEKQVLALEKLADAKQRALALAVEKQEAAYSARFDSVNEWRQTFGDLANRGITRDTFDSRMAEVDRRLQVQEQWQARTNGQFATWGVALLVLSTVIGVVARFINLGT